MVVDDNLDVAYTLGLMLEEIGHDHLVHDGREALTEAEAFRTDVVLVDIGLPGMEDTTCAGPSATLAWLTFRSLHRQDGGKARISRSHQRRASITI